jgi:ADP-ribose pyrophosphatase YjhB (NUDIX family)
MIQFDRGGARFVFRAAGVCVDAGRVLLHRGRDQDFWSLPGGRVELLEPSGAALVREMQEELGVAVELGPLLFVIENFFAHRGRRWHELGLYYRLVLPPGSPLRARGERFEVTEVDGGLVFEWFPLAEIERLAVYPTCLRARLAALPAAIEHIVHRDA